MKIFDYIYNRIGRSSYRPIRETRTPFLFLLVLDILKLVHMKEIKLTQGQIAMVDDGDFEYLNQFKWNAYKKKGRFYASRYVGKSNGRQIYASMHWDVMGEKMIDHIDHNGLNNQKSNLRKCTYAQNMMNGRKRNTNTSSKYKGVCWAKNYNKWISSIRKDDKQIHLGYFESEIDAAMAYNNKAKELFCEFACINTI